MKQAVSPFIFPRCLSTVSSFRLYLLTSFPETIEIVCLTCASNVVRDVHLELLDMCISYSTECDNSFHKISPFAL